MSMKKFPALGLMMRVYNCVQNYSIYYKYLADVNQNGRGDFIVVGIKVLYIRRKRSYLVIDVIYTSSITSNKLAQKFFL